MKIAIKNPCASPFALLISQSNGKGFGKGSLGKIVPVPYGSDRMQKGACGSGETFLVLDSKPIAPLYSADVKTITSQKKN